MTVKEFILHLESRASGWKIGSGWSQVVIVNAFPIQDSTFMTKRRMYEENRDMDVQSFFLANTVSKIGRS